MNKVKKLTLTLTITLLSMLFVLPMTYAATGTITVDTLRVRKTPSTSSTVLKNYDRGDKVEVIEKDGDWYKIKLPDGNEAYVYAQYVKLEEELVTKEEKVNETNVTKVNTNETNVTNESQTITKEILKLKKNTRVYILPVLFSNEITVINEDVSLEIIEKINNWACVKYNGIEGWVLIKDEVIETSTVVINEPTQEVETKTGYVNVSSAYVREEGNTSARVLTSLSLNSEVTILSEKNGWYEIKLSDGVGYIYSNLVSDKKTAVTSRNATSRNNSNNKTAVKKVETNVTTQSASQNSASAGNTNTTSAAKTENDTKSAPASTKGQEVANFAQKYKGYKYVYGGSSPSGFDCSGFTMYVFKKFGINLPHNANTQRNYGKHVNKSDLQPGDLMIFKNHAGIYIGNGKFIHAANKNRGVTIDSINSNYYVKNYVDSRRLV